MDFTHTEERRMLSDSIRGFLTDNYTIEQRNEHAYAAPFHSSETWQGLSEIGILSALISEAQGGFGGTGFDINVVFEELGRGLCAEPVLPNMMGIRLLSECNQSDLVNRIVAGEQKVAVAIYEPDNADQLEAISCQAQNSDGSQATLNGQKSVVYGAPSADVLLVVAKQDNQLGLYLVEDFDASDYGLIDGGGASDVTLNNTPATCISDSAQALVDATLNAARLALCAEAVGAMDVLLEMTIEYLKQRQQFGQPIALFQALQHRCVDMAVEIEQCRSITTLAASKLGTEEEAEYVSKAKNLIGRGATLIAEEATQLHGGIGMTWEYAGAHYTKRLVMIDHQFGDQHQHLEQLVSADQPTAA